MGATLTHTSFKQPADPKVSLWRYMDLSKFASLLQTRALVFPRADRLGDPFEGSVPAANIRFYEAIRAAALIDPGIHPLAALPAATLDAMQRTDSDLRKAMVRSSHVSCWHMNDAESAAMWKMYSKSSDAVCIRTDYMSLAKALPKTCHMGVVQYIDFNTAVISADNAFNPLMSKRRSFAYEQEVRVISSELDTAAQYGEAPLYKEFPVNLTALVKAIYVSPEAPDWFRDVVANLAAKYRLKVAVEHSEMNAAPLF